VETVEKLSGSEEHLRADQNEEGQVRAVAIPGNHESAGEEDIRDVR